MESRRIGIYCRQSSTDVDERGESLSIESQTRACREYVARTGGSVAGVYADEDEKGWKASRPAFDRMLDDIRAGAVDCVVVFKLSRFMRSLLDQERFVGEIAAAGGELVSVMEPYISTSPMVRQILGAVNEQHRRDISDFLKATWGTRSRRGLHHGPAPYGYTKSESTLTPDEPAASVVRDMYAWAAAGDGGPTIAARLNQRGIGTPRRGSLWGPSRVLELLRRPVYAGLIALNGEIVTEGAHEPLVDRETWETVQATLARRRYLRRKETPSWVDGHVLHACGARMTAMRGHGDRWRYRCTRAGHGGARTAPRYAGDHACPHRPLSMAAERIERAFAALLGDALATLPSPDAVAARIEDGHAERASERTKHRQRLERRIADVTGQRDRLLDLTLRGAVEEDAYKPRDAALRAELKTLRDELAAVPAEVDVDAITETHAVLTNTWLSLDMVLTYDMPMEIPDILRTLDVCIVIADGEPRLRWPARLAAFVEA